jgi:hypothetical protein
MRVDAKLAELVPLSHKCAKQGRVGFFHNERTGSTPLDPKLIFLGVSVRSVTAQKLMQNLPNWCHSHASSLHKVASEFFATNAPDPLHLTQNSSFGVFRTVLLLHGSRCKTGRTVSTSAQVRETKSRSNFSQRTHEINSIGPKTHVFERFGPFCYSTKVVAKLAELVPLSHKFTKQSRVGIFCNERTSSTPLDPKLMF